MRAIATVLACLPIRAYQWLISPLLPPSCRFRPTCSAYALEAVRRFGPVAGGWLALRRIVRCHPWGGCGDDPVPTRVTSPRSERLRAVD